MVHNSKPTRRFPGRVLALLVTLALLCCTFFSLAYQQIEKLVYPRRYEEYVTYYAEKYDIDPLILYTFIRTESSFNSKATSNVDARGLMQLTEVTFEWIKSRIAPEEDLTFDDMNDPETNIRFGTYFVRYCLLRYHEDLPTAAAAYHSGWGTVDRLLEDERYSRNGELLTDYPYPQMRRYVQKITDCYQRYQQIYSR